jgi:type IV pilus assembly protein PilC
MSKNIILFSSISLQEKLLFTKHLSVMIKSGIPLAESIELLAFQTKNKEFKNILNSILLDIQNGQSLSKSISKFPKIFSNFFISLVTIGEKTGTLEKSLQFLSIQLSKDYSLKKKIQGALMYPGLIFAATIIVGGFISLVILPQLVDFFSVFDQELPLSTRFLLSFANLMKDYGLLIFGGLILFFILLIFFLRLPFIKKHWHSFILKLPLFGKIIHFSQLARFSRNLGILLQSGIPIVSALETTAQTLNNLKFKTDINLISKRLSKGKKISEIINDGDFSEFPNLVTKMIGVGEQTGHLEDTLLYLADFYEEEIDNISKNLNTILEPFLLLFIGLIVAFVALAVISPIYQLTGSIRR